MLSAFSNQASGKSDVQLIAQYRTSGDLKVLGILYDRYVHLVYGTCLKYLKDREDSQDAVMQIFEKLIREVTKHEIENFRGWLFVLTKNHCLMQLRTRQTALEHLRILKDEEEVFMETAVLMHHEDDGNALDSDMERLRACIDQLKDHQRDCVLLFYLEQKPYREIVDLLDIDMKKVKSYIQNARRNLKICMERSNE